MKDVIIITPFDNYSYQVRIKYIERIFSELGYTVRILSSDFDHRNKVVYSSKRNNLELLHVYPYKKNISVARILSHNKFAKQVYKKLIQYSPEIVYCSAPPNFLLKYLRKYKHYNSEVKLIFEVGDL